MDALIPQNIHYTQFIYEQNLIDNSTFLKHTKLPIPETKRKWISINQGY